MKKTANLNLNKPEDSDTFDVGDFNENADTIDGAIKDLRDSVSQKVAFTSNGDPFYLRKYTTTGGVPRLYLYADEAGKSLIGYVNLSTS